MRIRMTGEPRQPLRKKLNPIWWFLNDFEPAPPDWFYERHTYSWWPQWFKFFMWYVRNPMHNFGRYVLGVVDRDFDLVTDNPYPLSTHPREDWFNGGNRGPDPGPWKFHWLEPEGAEWLKLPFVSYDSQYIRFYAGWQHWGFFGIKAYIKGVL